MPVSIQDVAARANVSISTVSRVLNRRNIVNEETRKRVESAISELGYKLMISSVGAKDDGSELMAAVGDHGLVDGLAVMISEINARTRATLEKVKIPLVVLDGDIVGVKHDAVVIDQRQGAVAMLR